MIDGINVNLLNILQNDARTTNAAMAETVGLAPSAVHERMRRLSSSGLIERFAAVLCRSELGYGVTAFVHVRTAAPLEGVETAAALGALDRVLEVHDVAGADCFLLKVIARDIPDLHELVNRHIGAVPGVVATSTTIVMKTVKETARVPIPEQEDTP